MGIKKRELLKMIEELAIAGVNLEKEVVVLCKAVRDQSEVISMQNKHIDKIRNSVNAYIDVQVTRDIQADERWSSGPLFQGKTAMIEKFVKEQGIKTKRVYVKSGKYKKVNLEDKPVVVRTHKRRMPNA